LTQAIFLALVALGSGLTVSVWWAWQTAGTLTAGDPREIWMAVTWLTAAMSLVAWQLEGHRGRWAAGLALAAALYVGFGLVFLTYLQSLLGI
jgi:ABC-type transport system involved in cytochrome c biogenesis permease subunit